MLHLKSATLDCAAAKDFKVTLLHPAEPAAGKVVELGVFTLPKLETSITAGPKGASTDLDVRMSSLAVALHISADVFRLHSVLCPLLPPQAASHSLSLLRRCRLQAG